MSEGRWTVCLVQGRERRKNVEMGAITACKADRNWACGLQALSSAERPGLSAKKQHWNISSQHTYTLWPNRGVSLSHYAPLYVRVRPAAAQVPPRRRAQPWPSALCDCWAQSWQTTCPCPCVWTDLACACSHLDRGDGCDSFSLASSGWTADSRSPFLLQWIGTAPWYA